MSLRNQDRLRGSGIFTFPFDVRETDYSCSHLIGWSVQFFTRPNTNGPVFYPTKGRLGPKKSKMAAVFVQERNAASILVMSVSSWCEGHRSRQELNEISFASLSAKNSVNLAERVSFPVGRLASTAISRIRNSEIYVLLKSGN